MVGGKQLKDTLLLLYTHTHAHIVHATYKSGYCNIDQSYLDIDLWKMMKLASILYTSISFT